MDYVVYNNLKPVRLSYTEFFPNTRDGLIYSNIQTPWHTEGFVQFLTDAINRIATIEKNIMTHDLPRISELLNLPLSSFPADKFLELDTLCLQYDSDYKRFGVELPTRMKLKIFAGLAYSNSSSREYDAVMQTLLHTFPDLRSVWNEPITSVSLQVLSIIRHASVYYRRAQYLTSSTKLAQDMYNGDITQMQAARANFKLLSTQFQSHLSETAPHLESVWDRPIAPNEEPNGQEGSTLLAAHLKQPPEGKGTKRMSMLESPFRHPLLNSCEEGALEHPQFSTEFKKYLEDSK